MSEFYPTLETCDAPIFDYPDIQIEEKTEVKKLSAAVITRIQAIEGPFINEWFDWYLNRLGFTTAYLINTEGEETLSYLKQIISLEFIDKIVFLNIPDGINQNRVDMYMLKLAKEHVKEPWLLHIDTDELLILGEKYTDINKFIEKNMEDDIHALAIRWVLLPCNDMYNLSMTKYSSNHNISVSWGFRHEKCLMYLEYITGIEHHIVYGTKITKHLPIDINGPVIYHYIVRSKTHTILKILHQKFDEDHPKSRNNHIDIVKSLLTKTPPHISKYPSRLLLSMYEYGYAMRNNIWSLSSNNNTPISKYSADINEIKRQLVTSLQNISIDLSDIDNAIDNIDKNTDYTLLPAHIYNSSYKDQLETIQTTLSPLTLQLGEAK
jgi:hypothetical protein